MLLDKGLPGTWADGAPCATDSGIALGWAVKSIDDDGRWADDGSKAGELHYRTVSKDLRIAVCSHS